MAVDLTGLIAAVSEAETVDASAVALIEGFAASVSAAVTAALEADASADQASIDAANAAIQGEVDKLEFWKSHLGPQTWALIEDAKEICFGGSRGGGKSSALIAWLTLGNLKLPPTHPCHYSYLNHPKFRALVLRRDATDLKDFVSEASAFFRYFGLIGGKK
jgi:hypothetical protein